MAKPVNVQVEINDLISVAKKLQEKLGTDNNRGAFLSLKAAIKGFKAANLSYEVDEIIDIKDGRSMRHQRSNITPKKQSAAEIIGEYEEDIIADKKSVLGLWNK